jgi:mevalonate kinase
MDGAGEACGKVILLGEHAVVYGVPAIAVAIERGARAQASPLDDGPSRLRVPQWEVDVGEEDDAPVGADALDRTPTLARAFRALLEATRDAAPGLRGVRVDAATDLPPGGGLGCSAALGVAIARAIDPDAGLDAILPRVAAWERVFHGNPSGVDAAVAARGGCMLFERLVDDAHIVPVCVQGALVLCIGHTGVAASTRAMVDAVARLKMRRPEMVAKTFDGIRSLVRNARLAIEAGDTFALGRLLDLNQILLSGLFVSTEEIERMCDVARSAGACGVKLTGAGGGGSVVALAGDEAAAERVLEAWAKAGFSGFATRVAGGERAAMAARESERLP